MQGSKNRLTLTVRGRRSDAERAFALTIGDYRLGDREFYSNDRDPGLPARTGSTCSGSDGIVQLLGSQSQEDLPELAGAISTCLCVDVIAGLQVLA